MANENSNTPTPAQQPRTVPLSQIHELPGVFNPKPVESKLSSLILSIQNSGVMEPVILRQRDDGEYQLLSGYRRCAASERAGKKDIPAFVYEMTMQEAIAYRKAVKDDHKAPVPGKLLEADVKEKDKRTEPAKPAPADKDGKAKESATPAVSADKDKAQTMAGGKEKPDQPVAAEKGKGEDKPAGPVKPTEEKDNKAKERVSSAAPADKDKTQPAPGGKDKPSQPDTAEKGKDGEKSAGPVKPSAEKDGKAKESTAPAAPGDQDKPAQPGNAEKGEAEHKPTVAELEAKVKAGGQISLSELADAAKREREAKEKADKEKQPESKPPVKGVLHPVSEGAKQQAKAPVEKKAAVPLVAAVKGSASTAIKQVLADRLDPPTEESWKSIPVPGDGESVFVTLHPAYLEKSPLNTFSVDTSSDNFKELCKSIELVGIKDPVLARFNAEGRLEILSGQRRHIAAKMLNRAVPTIIQKIDDADAKILVADGNLHRDRISSYDLSRALRMKMEGMKQKAGRRKRGFSASELQSDEKLAREMGMSVPKLNRMIHLSEAVKGVCDLVDDGKLTISVASEIAYLHKETQESLLHLMDLGYKATNERIQRIKKVENGGKKANEMTLRFILDDKDIAAKQQQPKAPASQPSAPQQPATTPQLSAPSQPASAPQPVPAPQPTPGTQTPQQPNAPAPETIPASPNVTTPPITSPNATVNTENAATEQKPETPGTSEHPVAPPMPEKADADDGRQERPENTKVILTGDRLRKYFPDVSMTPRAIEESIYEALEERRQRQLRQQQKPNLLKR
jgi:ParB/RepB/Spo0J family partition protein